MHCIEASYFHLQNTLIEQSSILTRFLGWSSMCMSLSTAPVVPLPQNITLSCSDAFTALRMINLATPTSISYCIYLRLNTATFITKNWCGDFSNLNTTHCSLMIFTPLFLKSIVGLLMCGDYSRYLKFFHKLMLTYYAHKKPFKIHAWTDFHPKSWKPFCQEGCIYARTVPPSENFPKGKFMHRYC